MKRVLLLLWLCSFQVSIAGDAEDEALQAFVEEFGKSFLTEVLKRNADRYLTEKLGESVLTEYFAGKGGEEAAGYVSNALAIYGIYRGVEAFEEAQRQSDRYYASVQIVGSAASFVNPAVGFLISLGGMGEQMLGAWYEKSEMKKLLDAEKRVQTLGAEVIAQFNHLSKAESAYVRQVMTIYEESRARRAAAEGYLAKHCADLSSDSGAQTVQCVFTEVRSLQEIGLAYAALLKIVRLRLGPIEVSTTPAEGAPPIVVLLHGYQERIHQEEAIVQRKLDFVGAAYARARVNRLIEKTRLPKAQVCYRQLSDGLSAANVAEMALLRAGENIDQVNAALAARLTALESMRPLLAQCEPGQFESSPTRAALAKQRKVIQAMMEKDWEPYLQERL